MVFFIVLEIAVWFRMDFRVTVGKAIGFHPFPAGCKPGPLFLEYYGPRWIRDVTHRALISNVEIGPNQVGICPQIIDNLCKACGTSPLVLVGEHNERKHAQLGIIQLSQRGFMFLVLGIGICSLTGVGIELHCLQMLVFLTQLPKFGCLLPQCANLPS